MVTVGDGADEKARVDDGGGESGKIDEGERTKAVEAEIAPALQKSASGGCEGGRRAFSADAAGIQTDRKVATDASWTKHSMHGEV